MSVEDRKLKNINVRVKDSSGIYRTINLIEHDTVNLFFKDPDTKKTIQIETGEIIKIGLDRNDSPYLVIFSFNYYLDNNLFNVPCSSLIQVVTVNHSPNTYTLTPVYSADESVAVLRSSDGHLQYTINGKDWYTCGGGGSDITIDDVDREIEHYLTDYSTTAQVNEKISTATADFVTGDQVDERISEATVDFVTGSQVDEKISTATADFVTGSQVDTKIYEATAEFITSSEVDTKISEATADFVTGEQVDAKISRATENFITADEASTMIEEATADFVTGAQVDEKISTATADFITDTEADTKISEALVPYATLNDPTFTGNVNVPTYLQADNSNLVASTAYVRTAIEDLKEQIGSPLHFKGVVETEEDLHNIENPQIGDVYQVTHAQSGNNAEFAYTESGWIELGTIIDLTGYATIEDVTTAVDTGVENARVYTDTAVGSALSEAKTYADGVGTSTLNSAKSYTDEKVSVEATRADSYADGVGTSTLSSAKSYTDEKISAEETRANNYTNVTVETALETAKAYTDNTVEAAADSVKEYADSAANAAIETANHYADGVGTSALNAANEYTDQAIAAVEDVYEICKARGYLGTKDEFYDALTEVLNNISNIVINEQVRS